MAIIVQTWKKKQVIEIIHDHPATVRRHSFAISTWPVVKIQFMAAYYIALTSNITHWEKLNNMVRLIDLKWLRYTMIYLPCQFEIHRVYLGRNYENTDFNPWHEISCPLNSSNTHVKKRRAIQTWAYVKIIFRSCTAPRPHLQFLQPLREITSRLKKTWRNRFGARSILCSDSIPTFHSLWADYGFHGFSWNFRDSQPFYINTSSFFMELELPRCHNMIGRTHWTSKVVPQNLPQFNSWITVTMNYNSQVGWITIAMNNHNDGIIPVITVGFMVK